MSDFIIPVDGAVEDFANHINANPRTILSSKFGDGKSYFLQKVKENVQLAEKYEFLTIYPVNYQVVSNKDIFELIKRDILFQLMLKKMISNNVRFTDAEAFSWFLSMKGASLATDLLPYIAALGLEPEFTSTILGAMKSLKLFKSLKEKVKKFKVEELKTEDDYIEAFLKENDSHYIFECDVITQIIQKSIKDYKRRTNKKVVLIVEDLDRIDPAHLFRILNLFSAHMDFGYRYQIKPDSSLAGNKFGLDNIVLVEDFNNLKQIYKHFYGEHTDFNGYISKFLSSIPFCYSFENHRYKYIIEKLSELTGLGETDVLKLFPSDVISSKTIREVVQSFEIKNSIVSVPTTVCFGEPVVLTTSFIRVMAIWRRLKYTDDEISTTLLALKDTDFDLFERYILPYAFLCEKTDGNYCKIYYKFNHSRPQLVQLQLNEKTGEVVLKTKYAQFREEESCLKKYVDAMFKFIV